MLNPRLTETLTDFPFARLNTLIAPIAPPADLSMINLSVGEPQGAMPAFARKIVADEIDGWNRYPPNQGIPDLNLAIVEWLGRRYRLPAGLLDPTRHVMPTAGSKEGVYIIATVATPQQKNGARPVIALPNPFYQAYLGGAVLSGAEPLLVNASAETGFLPDFDTIDEATWQRMSVVYLCSPANPQGAIASIDYLQKLIAKCRVYDCVLAVDECYAEIYTREAPVGALEAALAMDDTGGKDPFRNVVVFHSLSKRSNAAGLRSGFMAGDPRQVAMLLRWRTYGGPQIPLPSRRHRPPCGARKPIRSKRGNGIGETSASPSRYCTTASATTRRAAAFSCGSMSVTARRRRAACGARRISKCCPAPMFVARPPASTPRSATFEWRWCTTSRRPARR